MTTNPLARSTARAETGRQFKLSKSRAPLARSAPASRWRQDLALMRAPSRPASAPTTPEASHHAPDEEEDPMELCPSSWPEELPVLALLQLRPRRELFPHQRTGVALMTQHMEAPPWPGVHGGLMLDGTRTGKTATCHVTWVEDLQRRVGAGRPRFGRPTVVVCSSAQVARDVWLRELRLVYGPYHLFGQEPHARALPAGVAGPLCVAMLTAESVTRPVDVAALAMQVDLIVTTYATMTSTERHGLCHALRQLRYRFLFCDEAAELLKRTTEKRAAMEPLHADARWWVTADLVQMRDHDMASAFQFIGVPVADTVTPEQQQDLYARLAIRRLRDNDAATAVTPVVALDFASAVERRLYEANDAAAKAEYQRLRTLPKQARVLAATSPNKRHLGMQMMSCIHRLQRLCLHYALLGRDELLWPADVMLPPDDQQPPPAAADVGPAEQFARVMVARGLTLQGLGLPDVDAQVAAWGRARLDEAVAAYQPPPGESMPMAEAFWAHDVVPRLPGVYARMLPAMSTKERWVCDTLLRQTSEPRGEKVVIFSRFRETLEHLAVFLRARQGLVPGARDFVYLHGRLARDSERQAVLDRFRSDPSVGCLLCTLKTGGVGLDLTVANHGVLYDPWWNPHTEKQALDRLRGINQTREVCMYRLMLRGTIEEFVVAHADGKWAMSEALVRPTDAPVRLVRRAPAADEAEDEEEDEDKRAGEAIVQSWLNGPGLPT